MRRRNKNRGNPNDVRQDSRQDAANFNLRDSGAVLLAVNQLRDDIAGMDRRLFGNGQPGVIAILNNDLAAMRKLSDERYLDYMRAKWWALGAGAAVGGLTSLLIGLLSKAK